MASLIIRMVLSSETKVGIMVGCGGSYELGCRGSRLWLTRVKLAELPRIGLARTRLARAELAQTELVRGEVV